MASKRRNIQASNLVLEPRRATLSQLASADLQIGDLSTSLRNNNLTRAHESKAHSGSLLLEEAYLGEVGCGDGNACVPGIGPLRYQLKRGAIDQAY
jgi:hypothetical protein